MAGKKKKKVSKKANTNGEKKKTKPKRVARKGRGKSSKYAVDIFTEVAMENAYTTCHNVQDLLKWRGFPWPQEQKKKKKGKK